MAVHGFLNVRIVLSCFRTYLVDSSYTSKNAFQLHFLCFKNKIPMSAAIGPVWDLNNNCKNADLKYYSYSSLPRFFFLARLVNFYVFYSSATAYGGSELKVHKSVVS